MADSSTLQVISATLSEPYMYVNSFGDTWTSTWADDDELYTLSCDTKGWYEGCTAKGSNLAVNRLIGGAPYFENLDGVTINPMKTHPYYYGEWAELKYDSDSKIRMWKANGLTCIDGDLYMSVSRHGMMEYATRYTQDAINASIIKSSDHGQTWSGSERENYLKPMFPGTTFSTPFFVEYAKNGMIPNDEGNWVLPPHGGDKYVYAVSSDGFWNNGNYTKLGRVERTKLANLDASDWEFYSGPANDPDSGMDPLNWVKDGIAATSIVADDGHIGQAGVQYVWPLNRYVMLQWYYPSPYKSNFDTTRTRWHFFESPTPWGPWNKFFECEFNGDGAFYNPDIISKSITYQPYTRSCSMVVLTAGDWKTCLQPDPVYRMHALKLTLQTE